MHFSGRRETGARGAYTALTVHRMSHFAISSKEDLGLIQGNASLAVQQAITAESFFLADLPLNMHNPYSKAVFDDRGLTWGEIWNDCMALERGENLTGSPLWKGRLPLWFITKDDRRRALWANDPPAHWAFWTRWWDGVLAGKPLNWDLQHDIALIPDEVWKAGPGPVAEAIAVIEAAHLLDEFIAANPYAMRVSMEVLRQKLVGEPIDSPDLDAILDAVRTALDDFVSRCQRDTNPNGFGMAVLKLSAAAIEDLQRDVARYCANPLRLYDAIGDACRDLQDSAKRSDIPVEGALFRLVTVLDRQATDIVGAAPVVLETVKRRNAVEFELLKGQQIAQAIRLCNGMAADSEGWLHTSAIRR
jgi:hypothetical protein